MSSPKDEPPVLPPIRRFHSLDNLGPEPPSWRDPSIELNTRISILLEMIRHGHERKPGRPRLSSIIDTHVAASTLYNLPTPTTSTRTLRPPFLLPAPLPKERVIRHVKVGRKVGTLGDLVDIIHDHPLDDDIEYDIDMAKLHAAVDPLEKLHGMVGLTNLKSAVCDQIIYYLQGLHEGSDNDYMHTVIEGPPGTGKTEVAKLIGGVFSKIGVLKKGTFKKVTRADMIAGYLGQTAIKTKKLIDESLGGVLFVDEAYSLGNNEQKDSYSKECLDTLCEALSDHKKELMVIIAGYEDQLDTCFFKYNEGLRSRFAWRFKTDMYSAEELHAIFVSKTMQENWTVAKEVSSAWFEKNRDKFKYAGRDIETLFSKTKIAHSRRLFQSSGVVRKEVTVSDLDAGYEMYSEHYAESEPDSGPIPSMYL